MVPDESIRFFVRLLVENHGERVGALRVLCAFLVRDENRALLAAHLARLVRMAASCPLRDWKAAATQLVAFARSVGLAPPVPPPISLFFLPSEIPDDDCSDAHAHALFREQFLDSGSDGRVRGRARARDVDRDARRALRRRLSYLSRLLALKADYATRLHAFQRQLMREPGPLAFETRNYVAMMASGRC